MKKIEDQLFYFYSLMFFLNKFNLPKFRVLEYYFIKLQKNKVSLKSLDLEAHNKK